MHASFSPESICSIGQNVPKLTAFNGVSTETWRLVDGIFESRLFSHRARRAKTLSMSDFSRVANSNSHWGVYRGMRCYERWGAGRRRTNRPATRREMVRYRYLLLVKSSFYNLRD